MVTEGCNQVPTVNELTSLVGMVQLLQRWTYELGRDGAVITEMNLRACPGWGGWVRWAPGWAPGRGRPWGRPTGPWWGPCSQTSPPPSPPKQEIWTRYIRPQRIVLNIKHWTSINAPKPFAALSPCSHFKSCIFRTEKKWLSRGF